MAQGLRMGFQAGDRPAENLGNGDLHGETAFAGAALPDDGGELAERNRAVPQHIHLGRQGDGPELGSGQNGERSGRGMLPVFHLGKSRILHRIPKLAEGGGRRRA